MRRWLTAACYFLCACPGGWQLQLRDGAAPSISASFWRVGNCVVGALAKDGNLGDHWKHYREADVYCADVDAANASVCNTAFGHRETPTIESTVGLESRLSFVHLSDAQLKEHNVRLRGPLGDEFAYDGISTSSVRSEFLEQNDDAALLSTVIAINHLATSLPKHHGYGGLPVPGAPSFVIHTGDAVDAGMFSELTQYLATMNHLSVPHLNVVGNHDNLFFGTLPADLMTGLNVVVPYVPIVTTERFMRYHSNKSIGQDPSLPYTERGADQNPVTPKPDAPGLDGRSLYHGFDYACPAQGFELCSTARGYYAFDLKLSGSTKLVRGVVLNTAEVLPNSVFSAGMRRSQGNMLPAQLAWFAAELLSHPEAYFLVFGHHNLESFLEAEQAEKLKQAMLENPRVLGYIAGHTHVDEVREWARSDKKSAPLWEIIGGSTLIYPQFGRLVELLENKAGSMFLRVLSFRAQLGDGAVAPRETVDALRCEPINEECRDVTPLTPNLCTWLAERTLYARSAAKTDQDDDRRDAATAIQAINGVYMTFNGEPKQ
jgi:hypothetical protein